MTQQQFDAVDAFIGQMLLGADAALEQATRSAAAAQLPNISVSPAQGKLLHLIARMLAAGRILELGTLAGYSTIWLARALPPTGRLITVEFDPRHAEVARANIERAGLSKTVEIRIARALDVLVELQTQPPDPFDLIFIDADKANTPVYFEKSLRLTRPGGVIIVDNVIRKGAVTDPNNGDADVQGIRKFYAMVRAENRVDATAIQTVGVKGWDGLAIVRVKQPGD